MITAKVWSVHLVSHASNRETNEEFLKIVARLFRWIDESTSKRHRTIFEKSQNNRMFRRRPNTTTVARNLSIDNGGVDDNNDDKLYHDNRGRTKKMYGSFPPTRSPLVPYAAMWLMVFIRSYIDGITAAGNETWYPVPLIGFIRSELAFVCFIIGSIPFLVMALGWTYFGILLLSGLAINIPTLVMPGPIPVPDEAYLCFTIITIFLGIVVVPFRKKPQASIAAFLAISIIMPNLPERYKPLFSSVPVELIPEFIENYDPDIFEAVGAAELETDSLLQFVWENRNDWVKVSHGRALGYFVFG